MRNTTTAAALLLTFVSFASMTRAQPSLSVVASSHNRFTDEECSSGPPTTTPGTIAVNAACGGTSATARASYAMVLGASAGASYGWQAGAAAGVTDTYTPTATGRAGQAGQLIINFAIGGSVSLSGSDNIYDATGEFNACSTNPSGSSCLFASPLVLFGPATISMAVDFIYGRSFSLNVVLRAGAFGRYEETNASADFGHTAEIASFEFRDATGDPVQGVTVTSQSGVNPFATTAPPPPPPHVPTIDDVIAAVDAAVLAGTLDGAGPGSSAKGRLGAWRNMLASAKSLIRVGSRGACTQLQDAYLRADGAAPPPDFVAGSAASSIDAMIHELQVSLGCISG